MLSSSSTGLVAVATRWARSHLILSASVLGILYGLSRFPLRPSQQAVQLPHRRLLGAGVGVAGKRDGDIEITTPGREHRVGMVNPG